MKAKRKKTGGRITGVSRNKATIEREINAAQVIDRARNSGRDLAVTVLEQMMNLARETMHKNRPAAAVVAKGKKQPQNWEGFGQWFDRTVYCSKELAKYQSPQIRAMEAPTPPPDSGEVDRAGTKTFKLRVFEGGKPLKAA